MSNSESILTPNSPGNAKEQDQACDVLTPSDSYVQSFARGLMVIRSFSASAREQTMSQVACTTGLTRAGARRILHTLLALGYVSFDGKYFALTPKILDLGFAYLSAMPIWNLAEPVMETLSQTTQESCSAAVLDGSDIVYVLRMPTRKVMSISLGIGSRLPAHCTSMGRMLLSDLPDSQLLDRIGQMHRPALTSQTLVDPQAIAQKIAQARSQGWCIVDQELEEGLVSMAAPIKGRSGKAVAALNVSGQANRTPAGVMQERMLEPLLAAAQQISRMLGA